VTIARPPKELPKEIKIVAHSMLFYWWPVWFFGFVFALWTYADNHRLAIINSDSRIINEGTEKDPAWKISLHGENKRLLEDAIPVKADKPEDKGALVPGPRVTPSAWMGPVYFTIVFLVIMITSVPLRGLWSLITILLIIFLTILFSVTGYWAVILRNLGDLHIYMNMAAYLAMGVTLFAAWVVTILVFDPRRYVIFSAGQIRVCEEIGMGEKIYDSKTLTLEKHRDDWFRHIVLGIVVRGTGDLTINTAMPERNKITIPNVLGISSKIDIIERLLKQQNVTSS